MHMEKKTLNSEKRDLPAIHNGHITVHENDGEVCLLLLHYGH